MYLNMVPGLRADRSKIDDAHHGWAMEKIFEFWGFESAILEPISSQFETNLWKNNWKFSKWIFLVKSEGDGVRRKNMCAAGETSVNFFFGKAFLHCVSLRTTLLFHEGAVIFVRKSISIYETLHFIVQ